MNTPQWTSRLLLAALLVASPSACVNVHTERGVEARWRKAAAQDFEVGETTRGEVLEALGPPSQILSLNAGSAFYYMLETTEAQGLILVVYNDRNERTTYDRAVYFFDEQGVLTDFSASPRPR